MPTNINITNNTITSSTGSVAITNSTISCPGTGTASERFGASASSGASNSLAVGASATVDATGGGGSVAIGPLSHTYHAACTAVGLGALAGTAGSSNSTSLGAGANASGSNSVAIAGGAAASGSGAIAIGVNTVIAHASIGIGQVATSTADNQFIVGSDNLAFTNAYLGNGVTNSSPVAITYHAPSGSGTNITGAAFNIASGQGTGNANSGDINFRYAPAGTSGSTLNALATTVTISGTDGSISCPGSGIRSERFGYSTSAPGTDGCVFGNTATISGALISQASVFGSQATVSGSFGTALGYGSSASDNATAVGAVSAAIYTNATSIGQLSISGGVNSTAIGHATNAYINGVVIGNSANNGGFSAIALGSGSTNTAANQLVIGSSVLGISNSYIGNGVTNAAPQNTTINATSGSGAGVAGANLTLAAGLAGDATTSGGSVAIKTAQTTNGTALVNRQIVNSVAKALTSATPVGIISVDVPTGTMAAGQIRCSVRATDATDFQALSAVIYWSAVNKTGTAQADANANAFSTTSTTGTLTLTADTSVSGSTVTIRATGTSSLTTTTFDFQYTAENNSTQDITIL